MPEPILFDSVSLQHFGVANRLDILEDLYGSRPLPRWTEEVQREVSRGALGGHRHCTAVIAQAWLGVPQLINARDELEVYRLQVALNDHVEPPEKHRGEAESIHIAEKIGGSLLTDDSGAYDFAVRRGRIATGRVIDSVQVLRNAVAMTYITKEEAKAIFDTVVTTLRDFRRCHPTNPTAEYFDI